MNEAEKAWFVDSVEPIGVRFLEPDGDERGAGSGVSEEEEFLRGGGECQSVVKGSVKLRRDTCSWSDHRQ